MTTKKSRQFQVECEYGYSKGFLSLLVKKPRPIILISISHVKSTVCTRSITPYTFDSSELGSFNGLSRASMTEDVKMRHRMTVSNHLLGGIVRSEGQLFSMQPRQQPDLLGCGKIYEESPRFFFFYDLRLL